jgi:hypothetical protein
MALQAVTNNPELPEIREELSSSVCVLMNKAKQYASEYDFTVPERVRGILAQYADSVALSRSPVIRDIKGNIAMMPKPEVGTSLAQDFSRVYSGLKLLGIIKALPYIARLAWDCIPSMRAIILRNLKDEPKTVLKLEEITRLPKSSIYYHIKDLQLLGVIHDTKRRVQTDGSVPYLNMYEENDDSALRRIAIKLPPIPKIVHPDEY